MRTSGKVPSLQLSALNKWFPHERSQPFWPTHEHEKLPSCQSKGWEVSQFLSVVDPWTMILLPVLCETIRAIGPLVFVRAFWGASFVVKTKKTPLLTTTQVQLWPKMAQELNPHGGWKERSRHNNTQKILMEHFWSNFNTRLIVFSWTHCCQDVNCFGIFFLPF